VENIKAFFAHPIIQFAIALGASTIILAYFSKRVLPEPLSNLELALPQLLAVLFEGIAVSRNVTWYQRPRHGIVVLVVVTFLVIVFNA
jgi:hypothetical protein